MHIKNTNLKQINILGIPVAAVNISQVVQFAGQLIKEGQKGYVTVTGVHGIIESQKSYAVKHAHLNAFLTVPDGMPLVYIGRWKGFKKIDRCYGPDLMLAVMEESLKHYWTHYFYGGKEGVAQELKMVFEKKFPGIKIVGTYTPPFRPLNDFEKKQFISEINRLKPNFIWVGLSTPKQELFMYEYLPLLNTNIMVGVGAAFDFHTGQIPMAPRWMQRMALEWLYRLLSEPKRLWKRYFYIVPTFLFYFLLQELGLKKFHNEE